MARVLIAEDEEGLRSFVEETLTRAGHDVTAVADGHAAIAELREGGFDVVVTDMRMPKASGMDVLAAARLEQPDVQVIVLTAFGDVTTAVSAMKQGAFDYVEKPIESPAALRALVASALARKEELSGPRAKETHGSSAASLGALSFGAPSMRLVVEAIGKVARTDATVLLLGESGSGKEVAARAIHEASPRKSAPFVAINCAVLSENLLESELFGHEKGAFTGAVVQRKGRIELAAGGTFFLDEVGELRPSLQAKLLRVLEERTFERLGGGKAIAADVRWIAATHRDLRKMVAEGSFRDDLYHRLAVFPVHLPPLRERREDIVPLARALLIRIADGKKPARLTHAAEASLLASDWPGNVRELRNALERAVILADGSDIEPVHLELPGASSPRAEREVAGEETLESLEKKQIERTLAAVGGHRQKAAASLGIGLRTLYEKLKKHGIR